MGSSQKDDSADSFSNFSESWILVGTSKKPPQIGDLGTEIICLNSKFL